MAEAAMQDFSLLVAGCPQRNKERQEVLIGWVGLVMIGPGGIIQQSIYIASTNTFCQEVIETAGPFCNIHGIAAILHQVVDRTARSQNQNALLFQRLQGLTHGIMEFGPLLRSNRKLGYGNFSPREHLHKRDPGTMIQTATCIGTRLDSITLQQFSGALSQFRRA